MGYPVAGNNLTNICKEISYFLYKRLPLINAAPLNLALIRIATIFY